MGEASCGAQEAGWNESAAALPCGPGLAWASRSRLWRDDVLDAADVDQIEAESAPAGAVDPVGVRTCSPAAGASAPGAAAPTGRCRRAARAMKPPDMMADVVGLADHPLGIAHRVRRELLGDSRRSRCSVRRAAGVRRTSRARPGVRAHDLAVRPHPELRPTYAGRQRSRWRGRTGCGGRGGPCTAPGRRIEALGLQRAGACLLDGGEDDERLLTRGTVDAFAGHFGAPPQRLPAHVLEVDARCSPRKKLSRRYCTLSLHLRLPLGVAHRRLHRSRSRGGRRIRRRSAGRSDRSDRPWDGGFQIVDHHPCRHPAEVLPGVLQAVMNSGSSGGN